MYPLWLPKGSIRGLLALIIIGSTVTLTFLEREIPDSLWTLAAAVAALYFEHRRNGGSG